MSEYMTPREQAEVPRRRLMARHLAGRPVTAEDLAALPPKWAPRRAGEHDWSAPGGTCATCGVCFLDAAGPCTWAPV